MPSALICGGLFFCWSINSRPSTTFPWRNLFAERNRLHDLVRFQIDLDQLRSAGDWALHFWRGGIKHPKDVICVNDHALHADEMHSGRSGFVPFIIWERLRLAIN